MKTSIKFAQNKQVTVSPRGYVVVRVRGTDIEVTKSMDPDMKDELSSSPWTEAKDISWRKTMSKLEIEAIEEAKKLTLKYSR